MKFEFSTRPVPVLKAQYQYSSLMGGAVVVQFQYLKPNISTQVQFFPIYADSPPPPPFAN